MSAVVVLAWFAGWLLFAGLRRFRPGADPPARSVSVVVPARDEAERLPRLLDALARSHDTFELLVVDDDSTDETSALARDAGATVIPVAKPAGWTGKTWACHQGAAAATGEVLVFLDADTEPGPSFVGSLAARAARTGGVVSVQPWHRVRSLYEHLSAYPNLVVLLGAGTGGLPRWRWWRRSMAFGPAIAVRRDVYLDLGGHGAVRGEVAEDVALAAHASRRRVPVEAWAGGDITYRMYPEGPSSLVEGWTKNLATGASSTAPLRAAAVALWVTGGLSTVPLLAGGPAEWLWIALYAVQALVLMRRVGSFGVLDALAYPVLLAAFVGLFVVSFVRRVAHRPPRWRGRRVPERTR